MRNVTGEPQLCAPEDGRKRRHRFAARPLLRAFKKRNDGATAIEFAMVALPFFALLFGIFEVALVYFGTYTLENAVEQVAREIRTGQAQTAGMTRSQFITKVCAKVAALANCESKLQVDAQAWPTFGAMNPGSALGQNGDLDPSKVTSWNLGQGGDVVLVRAYYPWDLIGRIPGVGLSNQSDGSRLLSAMATFRNEPFEN